MYSSVEHTLALPPLPSSQDLPRPICQREAPMTRHQDSTDDVDDLHQQLQEPISTFLDAEKNRFDVILEEDTRDGMIIDFTGLFSNSVLVCDDGLRPGRGNRVHRWHNGEEVLKFMEVVWCGLNCAIQWVEQGRVEFSKRELRDDV